MATQELPVVSSRPDGAETQGAAGRVRAATAWLQRRRDRLVGLDEPEVAAGRSPWPAWAFFVVAALAYPLYQLLTRGRQLLSGSMWAEMATNYYAAATSDSLSDQLLTTDAGYLPLPQRVIASVGDWVGLPPSAVPYLYTGSAVLVAALLIASVCLPVFRPVIASDGLRFVLALALVLVPDFETRTFINFTYFAVVPAVALTALGAVQRDRDVPGWAWLLPLFMLSKPGVLAVLPAMVVVAVVSRRRFRWVTAASVVAGLVQVVRLAMSSSTGTSLLQESDQSAFSKLYTALKYTAGLIGRLLLGPGTVLTPNPWMFWGVGLTAVVLAAALVLRARATPLVPIGLSLVLFTMILDCFSFSAAFSRDMALLGSALDRRFIVAAIGLLFVAAATLAMVFESPRVVRDRGRFGRAGLERVGSVVATGLFVGWFAVSGWLDYAGSVNRPLGIPVAEVSQWDALSPQLADVTEPVLCVPVDPFGWIYGRNCGVLVDDKVIPSSFGWLTLEGPDDDESGTAEGAGDPVEAPAGGDRAAFGDLSVAVELTVPDAVHEGALASLAVMVQPPAGTQDVTGRAVVVTTDGEETVLSGGAELPGGGGLVQFTARPTPLLSDVQSVRLEFDQPVAIAAVSPLDGAQTTVVLWMGQPAAD